MTSSEHQKEGNIENKFFHPGNHKYLEIMVLSGQRLLMMKSFASCSHESSSEYFQLEALLLNTVHAGFYCFGSMAD